MYETILIPVGGGVHTGQSVEMGVTIATACDASVHILRLIDTNWRNAYQGVSGSQLLTGKARNQSPDSHADDRRVATQAGTQATREAEESGINVVNRIVDGRSHENIPAYATDFDADLIVMSTRERTGRWVRRTLTSRVVARTAVPVLVVPAAE
jgi:nucleotide-binding universal stress UspA family protein